MPQTIKIATRDWDYLTPLILGDVTSETVDLKIERVATLIPHVSTSAYDAAEMSLSRYVSLVSSGKADCVGVPCFIMRGFRHRCIIVREDSPLERLTDLRNGRIGVTGWRDSGNTWTRAALRREGVGVEDAYWFAGRLTAAHPVTDRLDGFVRPGRIEAAPGERPMMDLLAEGELDAVFTPFMPEGYFGRNRGFRQLLRDFRAAEHAYYADVGYVPGMHIIAIKTAVAVRHPWLATELTRLIDASQVLWTAKRRKYAETSPWLLEELLRAAQDLAPDWNDSGLAVNRRMIEDFVTELHQQGILPAPISAETLFPAQAG